MFAAKVKMSARYMLSGSLVRSPSLNAGVGDVGQTIASTLLKGSCEILTDQGSNLLGTQIISIIVTRTQHIGAKNDATFDFRTKPLLPCFAVVVKKTVHAPWRESRTALRRIWRDSQTLRREQ